MPIITHILSTRPLHEALIKDAAAKGIAVDIMSFIETEAVKSEKISQDILAAAQQNCTAIFTSMNAVEAVVAALHGKIPVWDIFCMGNTTQNLVQQYFGSNTIVATGSNALELANQIIGYDRERKISRAIFFCGNQRRNELPDALRQNNIAVQEIVVYETIETPHKISKNYDGILFFSPSAVHSFFAGNSAENDVIFFAIGNTTADAVKQYSENKTVISQTPAKDALLQQAIIFFSQYQTQL